MGSKKRVTPLGQIFSRSMNIHLSIITCHFNKSWKKLYKKLLSNLLYKSSRGSSLPLIFVLRMDRNTILILVGPIYPQGNFSFFLSLFIFLFFIFWQQTFCFLLVGLRIYTFKVFLLFNFFSQYAFQFQQSFFTKFVRSVRDHLICIKLLF